MTEELFREDASLLECRARVLAVDELGIVLDRTVFYPQGGGQAGDAGVLVADDGRRVAIEDTRKVSGNPAAFFPTPMRLPTMRPIDNDTKAMRWARASVGDWG